MTLFMACLLCAAVHAQSLGDNQRPVGYTVTDDIDINGAAFGTAGTYTIGAVMTSDMLAPYTGCRILGIRVAAAMALGRARTFIYNIEDGGMTALAEQKQRLYEGWNNIFFNGNGIDIVGTENLFFGFDYTETDEMVAAEQGGICSVGDDVDGAFYLWQSGQFYQISSVGKLCVQLIVDVSSLPLYNLSLTTFDAGFKYKQPGETVDAYLAFANIGRAALASYQLGYQIDDEEPVYTTFDELLPQGASSEWQFSVPLPADITVGSHQLKAFAVVPGDASPATPCDETAVTFGVYSQSVPRNQVYMEVYTDQYSPYVPFLNEALAKLRSENPQLAIANVHRPGTPLAIDGAAYLHELYAYTYPTFTSNRSYFPGEAYIAYDMNDYLPVIGADMTASIIGDIMQQDLYNPSFGTIALKAGYDEATRQLTVEADGTLLPEATAIYGDVALTLLLTEDGVKSQQAVYNAVTQRTTVNSNYVHNQVLRTYMTAPTGDVITPSGDGSYTFSRTITLESGWQVGKMTVIALLTKAADSVTDDNVLDVDVSNCASLPLSSATGIIAVTADTASSADAWYNLNGQRVTPNGKGLYIHKGKKVVIRQ